MSVRRQSEGQLPCGDVRAVSHLSVVQDLRDVAGDRSFKHVFLGVGVIRIHNVGVLYFRSAPSQVLRGVPAVRRSFLCDSGVGVFDTPPHRRRRLLVCQTHQPLFGASFRTCHSPWVTLRARPAPRLRSWSEAGSAASVLEPAPGPHQGFFSDVTQFDLTDFAGQKRDLRTMEPVAGEIGHCFVVGARHQLRAWRARYRSLRCRAGM